MILHNSAAHTAVLCRIGAFPPPRVQIFFLGDDVTKRHHPKFVAPRRARGGQRSRYCDVITIQILFSYVCSQQPATVLRFPLVSSLSLWSLLRVVKETMYLHPITTIFRFY